MPEPPRAPGDTTDDREMAAALAALRRGAPEGMEQLVSLVYAELRGVAHRQLAGEPDGHTLSTTALVHEAWLRLAGQRPGWTSRAQFFALASRTMRRILIDYARRHRAARRGGPANRQVPLDALAAAARSEELLALDEALERLAALDPRAASVVECRFYGGLTEAETADALGVSVRTVASDWLMARGWLHQALAGEGT